jgi:hypothetical protein
MMGEGKGPHPGKYVLLRNHGGAQDPHRTVAPVKKKKKKNP